MSKDIIVLTPNGRRQIVKCTPNTTVMQILEDVCSKQGFEPEHYDLKHHNHILDLTTTLRFTNLPNKAFLEMVEIQRQRLESNVIIGLQMEDGERRTAEFSPHINLYDILLQLAPDETRTFQHLTVVYMRQEICGDNNLRNKTLRQLGLTSGRAILRLLNKSPEELKMQPNASSSLPVRPVAENKPRNAEFETSQPGQAEVDTLRNKTDTTDLIQIAKREKLNRNTEKIERKDENGNNKKLNLLENKTEPVLHKNQCDDGKSKTAKVKFTDTAYLERRLNIEQEVTFIGAQKAIAFMQPDTPEEALDDLPDDFYELTVDEVRKLYYDLQQRRSEIENAPLLSADQREEVLKQASIMKLKSYKHVVVRIQFPDRIILQGVFLPTDTVGDVVNFIKCHLRRPDEPFHVSTTPLKETYHPKTTLLEANFVPCVLMHFTWTNAINEKHCLKEDIYQKITSSDAAAFLASKYRSPNIREENTEEPSCSTGPSTSKGSKLPKWFRF